MMKLTLLLLLGLAGFSVAKKNIKCYVCKPGDGKPANKNVPTVRNCGLDTKYENKQVCNGADHTGYCFKESYKGNVTLGCASDKPTGHVSVCIQKKHGNSRFQKSTRCWCQGNLCNSSTSHILSTTLAALAILATKYIF